MDGALISISTIKAGKWRLIRQLGDAREFLKLPKGLQLIGDCGAWQYRYKDSPPYTVEEVLGLYGELGVDYGVTLDHIPFFGDPVERMRLTLENAIKSYDLWRPKYERGDYGFRLMVSVQGIEVRDYLTMLDKMYSKGYSDFAIGGLARRSTDFVERLVRALREELRRYRDVGKLHFLGVARVSTIPTLEELDTVGEISFDNATFLRMAWTRTVGNYVLPDGRVFTAIRIAETDRALRELLRAYDEGTVDLGKVVEALRERLSRVGDLHYLPYYAATLGERPWRECGCPICRSAGMDVLVFRGNNRNRRRGFHNVYVFSKLLKERALRVVSFKVMKREEGVAGPGTVHPGWVEDLREAIKSSKRILVLTHCTATKNVDMVAVSRLLTRARLKAPSFDLENEGTYREVLKRFVKPASEIYGGVFTSIKKLVKALRNCGKEVDLLIVSARYGVIKEGDPIIPYDATLKGMRAHEIAKWSVDRGVDTALRRLARGPYDLAVIVLPREYLTAVRNALSLLPTRKIVLISARSSGVCPSGVECVQLPGSNLPKRLKYVKRLTDVCEQLCNKKLTEIVTKRPQNR